MIGTPREKEQEAFALIRATTFAALLHTKYEGRSHTMINKTKGARILARTTGNTGYSLAERQISALTSELQSEGYYLAGRSTLHFSI